MIDHLAAILVLASTIAAIATPIVILIHDRNRSREHKEAMNQATNVSDELDQINQGVASIATSLDGINAEMQALRSQIASNPGDTLTSETQAKLDALVARVGVVQSIAASLVAPPAPASPPTTPTGTDPNAAPSA